MQNARNSTRQLQQAPVLLLGGGQRKVMLHEHEQFSKLRVQTGGEALSPIITSLQPCPVAVNPLPHRCTNCTNVLCTHL